MASQLPAFSHSRRKVRPLHRRATKSSLEVERASVAAARKISLAFARGARRRSTKAVCNVSAAVHEHVRERVSWPTKATLPP